MKIINHSLSAIVKLVFFVALLISSAASADVPQVCNDLARLAEAPGSHDDGTGKIQSESEISSYLSSYAEQLRLKLRARFDDSLKDPENRYFKRLVMRGLGLSESPACVSSKSEDFAVCAQNLLDGLQQIAEKQVLGSLPQKTGLERGMNSLKLEDIEYITANRGYQKVIKEMNAQVEKDLGKADIASKVQNVILPKVKKLIVSRLDKLSMSDKQRKLMIEKLESISFEGTNCRELGDGESENSGYSAVASLLVPNAFYDPMSNVFKICSGYLIQSTSEFDLVGTIAHELSHSIDPCTIARGPAGGGFQYSNQTDLKKMEQEYPLKNVIQCLRNRQSIEAKNFRMDITRQVDKDTFLAERDDVKKKSYSAPTFCEEDQIGESFCDWMAAEVLPVYMAENHKLTTDQYRNGYANVFRLVGDIQPDKPSNIKNRVKDVHPAKADRINKILLTNPKVRGQMGCPPQHPDYIYCDSEKSIEDIAKPQYGTPVDGAKPKGATQ